MNNLSSTFPTRLRELRTQRGWTQAFAAQQFGVQQGGYTNWENGVREPKFDKIIEMAKRFEVTTDYLLGLTDINLMEDYGKRLHLDLEYKNISALRNYIEALQDIHKTASQLALAKEYSKEQITQLANEISEYHLNSEHAQFLKRLLSSSEKYILDDIALSGNTLETTQSE